MTAAADRLTMALADRYRIERELGAGGKATVYLAEDLKRRCAPIPWVVVNFFEELKAKVPR